jgi:hypothetical protein
MSVMYQRHQAGLLCALGDGNLIAPYFPGQFIRTPAGGTTGGNYEAYANYPSTTPDQIAKVIRRLNGWPGPIVQVSTSAVRYTGNGSVTAGSPPSPISGSPFTYSGSASADNIYPRWTSETAWDFNAFAASANFTAQGITGGGIFFPSGPISSGTASFAVSFDTGVLTNDAVVGGYSSYDQEAEFDVIGYADEVCCWNEGTEIELNLVIYKIDFTTTAQVGSAGYFDITTGTASSHTTLTQTVTIDPSWGPGYVAHTFTIPKVVGHFTFVNDFYISSVTAP